MAKDGKVRNEPTGLKKCWDTCQCINCREDKTPRRETIVYGDHENTGVRKNYSVRIMEYRADDGSRFEKPISKAYYDNIKGREAKNNPHGVSGKRESEYGA